MTYKELNGCITKKCRDEVDRIYPSSEDLCKGLSWAIMLHVPAIILFVYNVITPLSLIAWGAICGIIGARMAHYYANKRVDRRQVIL